MGTTIHITITGVTVMDIMETDTTTVDMAETMEMDGSTRIHQIPMVHTMALDKVDLQVHLLEVS